MKRITFILVALFATAYSYAQLNVRNNAFIYVDDEIVFVEENVNLQETGTNFYLRKEAQLIQGAQTIANSGLGSLSQLEDVKTGFYGYNAWCSPVGGTINPQDVIFTNIGGDESINFGPVDFVSNTYTPNASPTQTEIADYWLWSYGSGTQYANWYHLQDTARKIAEGYGFLMKGAAVPTGNIAKDFRGLPNSGTITVEVFPNKSTLVGNPYPSALDARDFIHDPANVGTLKDATIRYYVHPDSGSHNLTSYTYGYASYTINSDGTMNTLPTPFMQNADITGDNPTPTSTPVPNTARRYIPIGQGFFVKGDPGIAATGANLTFANSQRDYVKRSNLAISTSNYRLINPSNSRLLNENSIAYNSNQFPIVPSEYKRFRLNSTFINIQANRELIHNFGDMLTDGPDYGYETTSSPSPTDAYFDNNGRTLNGIGDAYNIDMKIPFSVKIDNDDVVYFYLTDIQNFETNQPIYLHDLQTDEYFNIASNGHQIKLPAGDYTSRFEITFKNNSKILSLTEELVGSFNVLQNNSTQSLSLLNPNNLDVSLVSVYDVTGKQVFSNSNMNNNTRYEISTKSLSDAVYIVKVDFLDGTTTSKKVIVSNKR